MGGGLAGLRCAYELKKAGINSIIDEANPTRIGGRCYSNCTAFSGRVVENGGELVDTAHTNVHNLAKELGLNMDEVGAWADALGLEVLCHVDGHIDNCTQTFEDVKVMFPQFISDRAHAQFPQTWHNMTGRGIELDNMTVKQHIAPYARGETTSDFGGVLELADNVEYGAETDEQKCLRQWEGSCKLARPENPRLSVSPVDQMQLSVASHADCTSTRCPRAPTSPVA